MTPRSNTMVRLVASATGAWLAAFIASGGCATSVDSPDISSSPASSSSAGAGGGGQGGAASSSSSSSGKGGGGQGGAGGIGGAGGSPPECGNGKLEDGEQCDGSDFGKKTCADFGFPNGTLSCDATCNIDITNCAPAENCTNQADDDNDNLVDCDDPDCAKEPTCKDSCIAPTALMDGAMEIHDTTGKPDTLAASCSAGSGPEFVFEFTASGDGDLKIDVYPTMADLSLSVRTVCNDPGAEIACVDDGGAGGQESLLFKVKKGVTYTIIVDGTDPQQIDQFEIDLVQILPETDCSNYVDDDLDNFIDCADPTQCQMLADCKPGPGKVGSPCTMHNECGANANDPLCIDENDYNWPKGYCSEYCDVAKNDCPAGSVCADPTPLGAMFDWKNGLGACFKTCAKKADCPAGYMCADFGAGFVCKL